MLALAEVNLVMILFTKMVVSCSDLTFNSVICLFFTWSVSISVINLSANWKYEDKSYFQSWIYDFSWIWYPGTLAHHRDNNKKLLQIPLFGIVHRLFSSYHLKLDSPIVIHIIYPEYVFLQLSLQYYFNYKINSSVSWSLNHVPDASVKNINVLSENVF